MAALAVARQERLIGLSWVFIRDEKPRTNRPPPFSCLPPGPALEDDVLFPSLFTFCFLSLILMRTDLGVEPSTRWKYQIRPSGDRTPRGRRRFSQVCTILRS
eukprot:scaffold27932_cov56-Phaeocystis_antarctica.AAC.1